MLVLLFVGLALVLVSAFVVVRLLRGVPDTHNLDNWLRAFEDPERDAWQEPERVIASLALTPSSVVVDLGAATGYFSLRIAPFVPEGRVYAVDIEAIPLAHLADRIQREGIANVTTLLVKPKRLRLPEPADAVLLVNTYRFLNKRVAYMARLREQLRAGARVVIVDFSPGARPVGPPAERTLAPDIVERELKSAGYELRARAELPYQYLRVFTAP